MRVSTKFPIAIHSLLLITRLSSTGAKATSTAIAESTGSNPVIIRNIFADLKKSGLIRSSSGKSGGAVLEKEPKDISLWDVYCAVETDEIDEIFKFHDNPQSCAIGKNIYGLMLPHMRDAVDAMKVELQKVTLEILMGELFQMVKTK